MEINKKANQSWQAWCLLLTEYNLKSLEILSTCQGEGQMPDITETQQRHCYHSL